jgi:predicted nuclease of predicted toxin-antitoxin system
MTLLTVASAGSTKKAITGDWQVKIDFEGRQIPSILSFSSNKEGQITGSWASLWGLSELKDIKHKGRKLSFTQVYRFRESESEAKFNGTVKRRKLTGTLSGDRGESKVEGTRLRPMSRAAGNWDMKIKVDGREYTATLIVKQGQDRKLTADWQSQCGEHKISDVKFKKNKLNFKRTSKVQDRQWESTFEGTVKGHTLSGTFTSDRGEIEAEGKRFGANLIGKWNLEITSDRGTRIQMLQINPDLSGLYGPIAIEKVNLENNQTSFKKTLEYNERKREISFAGTLQGNKLNGELTTSRGARQVQGWRKGRSKPSREPDVVFVPTPQKVVDKMLEMAQVKKDDLVYDLGCGDGRIVVTAAKKFGCRAVGYDISPKRVKESLENVKKNNVGNLVRIEQQDIFTLDLSKANVVTLYLLPSLNVKLIPQLEKLKPGSRIVSHDFDMKGVKPDKTVIIPDEDDDYGDHTIYLWTTPLKKEKPHDKSADKQE